MYVDDLINTCDDVESIADLKKILNQAFTINDLGNLRYFFGIEVARENKGTMINRRKYNLDIVKYIDTRDYLIIKFHFSKGVKRSYDIGELLEDPKQYSY